MDLRYFFLLFLLIGIGSATVHFKISNNNIRATYKICINDGLENERCTPRNITLGGCLNLSLKIYWSDKIVVRLVHGRETLFAMDEYYLDLVEYTRLYYTKNIIKPFIFEKVIQKEGVEMWIHLEDGVRRSSWNYTTTNNDKAITSKLEVFCGQLTGIIFHIDENKDINSLDSEGATALAWAVMFGDVETVQTLIGKGANVNQLLGLGKISLIHVAAGSGQEEVLNILLEHGARADLSPTHGGSAMHAAVIGGNLNIAKKIFSLNRESVNATDRTRTPLHFAAQTKDPAFVNFLVSSGANIMARDFYEKTALHIAAEKGGPAVIKALVAAGIPIDDKAYIGRTPLMLAAMAGKKENVQTLIELGANVNAVNSENMSVLVHAKECPAIQKILRNAAVLTQPMGSN